MESPYSLCFIYWFDVYLDRMSVSFNYIHL